MTDQQIVPPSYTAVRRRLHAYNPAYELQHIEQVNTIYAPYVIVRPNDEPEDVIGQLNVMLAGVGHVTEWDWCTPADEHYGGMFCGLAADGN